MDDHKVVMDPAKPGDDRTSYRSVGVPIPTGCNEEKILKALVKLEHVEGVISTTNSALVPLTPMEKGFVLGILATVRRNA